MYIYYFITWTRQYIYEPCRANLSADPFSSRVNFKEPEAVRALTCTLLKEDFGLTIEIPLERLIPTVPLRLNYIHWVEDLIDGQKKPRRGIDIGTLLLFLCHIVLCSHHKNRETRDKNFTTKN